MTASRTEDAVDPAHPVQSIARLLAPRRGRLAAAFAVFIVKDSPVWLLPIITSTAVDTVVQRGSVGTIGVLAVIAVIAIGQNYPTYVVFTRLWAGASRQLGADLRNALTLRLQSLSIGFHMRQSASVIQTKVVRDVENIETLLIQAANPSLSAVCVIVGAVVVTAVSVPQFLIVYAATVPAGVGLWWFARRRSVERNSTFRREMENFSARVGEMSTLMPITRAHAAEGTAVAKVARGTEAVRSAGFELDMLNGRFASLTWLSFQMLGVGCILFAALAALLGWLDITPGRIVLLGTYFSLLTGAVTSLMSLYPMLSKAGESVRSISEVLQEPDLEHNEGKRSVDRVLGAVRLEDVSFTYPGASEPSVSDVRLDVRPGEMIAFVGSSGSGKSTLVNLVLGFLRPTSGRILLDGADVNELDLRTVRRFVSVVPQESVLFEGTVRENVAYGTPGIDDAQVLAALEQAHALDIIDGMPAGLGTVVGERGARLSGGQRQRLAIARALVRDPRILLLDEPTSALDPDSEQRVREALDSLVADRTTFVVAHRFSTIRSADRIVVLEQGRIVEIGSHDELLARRGRYAALHRIQFG